MQHILYSGYDDIGEQEMLDLTRKNRLIYFRREEL
jgi:hypothetical protein